MAIIRPARSVSPTPRRGPAASNRDATVPRAASSKRLLPPRTTTRTTLLSFSTEKGRWCFLGASNTIFRFVIDKIQQRFFSSNPSTRKVFKQAEIEASFAVSLTLDKAAGIRGRAPLPDSSTLGPHQRTLPPTRTSRPRGLRESLSADRGTFDTSSRRHCGRWGVSWCWLREPGSSRGHGSPTHRREWTFSCLTRSGPRQA